MDWPGLLITLRNNESSIIPLFYSPFVHLFIHFYTIDEITLLNDKIGQLRES